MSHLLALTLFAALVSPAFACLMRESRRDRVRFAVGAFFCFVGFAFVVGWGMALLD